MKARQLGPSLRYHSRASITCSGATRVQGEVRAACTGATVHPSTDLRVPMSVGRRLALTQPTRVELMLAAIAPALMVGVMTQPSAPSLKPRCTDRRPVVMRVVADGPDAVL